MICGVWIYGPLVIWIQYDTIPNWCGWILDEFYILGSVTWSNWTGLNVTAKMPVVSLKVIPPTLEELQDLADKKSAHLGMPEVKPMVVPRDLEMVADDCVDMWALRADGGAVRTSRPSKTGLQSLGLGDSSQGEWDAGRIHSPCSLVSLLRSSLNGRGTEEVLSHCDRARRHLQDLPERLGIVKPRDSSQALGHSRNP